MLVAPSLGSPPSRKNSTPRRLLGEAVHPAGPTRSIIVACFTRPAAGSSGLPDRIHRTVCPRSATSPRGQPLTRALQRLSAHICASVAASAEFHCDFPRAHAWNIRGALLVSL